MVRRRDVLALVQAGGAGGRMDVLTRERAKPALPFGGVHRLIDFTLSSLVYSDLRDVWVSVEYQVASIDGYLSGGRPWDLDASRGGFRRVVPQTGSGPATEDRFAHGNGDLLLRMARDLEAFGAPTLVVSSADHIFAADLRPIIADHIDSGLAATVLTSDVTKKEASQNVTVITGRDGVVTAIEEKPSRPSTGTVATELFIYQTEPLLDALRQLRTELSADAEGDDSGIGDFGEHLLPRLVDERQVRAVPLPGYWRDVGRPDAYLQGHRELLAGRVDVFDHPDRPVISKWQDRTAVRVRSGAVVEDSMLSPGCDISGTVVDSVLGPGVVVAAGAHVEDCVIFGDVRIERGARVSTSIIDERCRIGRDAVVGAMSSRRVAQSEEIVLMGRDSTADADAGVPAGARMEPGTTA